MTQRWKKKSSSWIGKKRINTVKMTILPKAIYKFKYNNPYILAFFIRTSQQMLLKFVQIAKTILRRKEQSCRHHIHDFKLFYKATLINEVWHLIKTETERSVKKNRESRNESMLIWSINLWQRRQDSTMGKGQPLPINDVGKTGQLYTRNKSKLNYWYFLIPYEK